MGQSPFITKMKKSHRNNKAHLGIMNNKTHLGIVRLI